jgi:beta-galactosidase
MKRTILKHEYQVNRRHFLKQTSLVVAGLTIINSPLRALASDFPEPFKPIRYRPIAVKVKGLKKNNISLDGTWQIHVNPGQNIREISLNNITWGAFQVPGQLEQQGYHLPKDKVIALGKAFSIPAVWTEHRIFLRFDAIHGGTNYWLNGKSLGYSENLFTPVEWEITDAVNIGQTNRLDLEMKLSTASERLSFSSGGNGNLSGIDRAVRIFALPKLHISTLHVNAGLDKNYKDGELQLSIDLDNPNDITADSFSVEVQLFNSDGKPVKHANPRVLLDPLRPGTNTVKMESSVSNPLHWNAEQPNLYKLVLTLRKDGHILETIERNIGFRTIETRNRQLYVNGVRVKLAGVCHHEIDPLSGRANTMRHAETDVKFFKSGHFNDVRTAHYPPTQEFLDAADRYGLYVVCEAPFCWVAPAKDLSDLEAILHTTSSMIDYNHAHPSVIMWSLANESHWSGLFEESNKLSKKLDPTRPTTFQTFLDQSSAEEDLVTCDIMNRHYPKMPFDELLKTDPRPLMIGECFFQVYHERKDVAVNPGLRELWAGGSADPNSTWGKKCTENVSPIKGLLPGIHPGAWTYLYESTRCIGVEIWSGIDDTVILPDGKIISYENGNAYWGLLDGWRRPKPELELSKFVFSPIWFPVRQLDYKPGQTSLRIPVENRYSFTNSSQFDFLWELNGTKGKARSRINPNSKGEIEIPLLPQTPEGSTLLLRVRKGKNEIINAIFTIGIPKPKSLPQPHAGAPEWMDSDGFITVKFLGFSFVLDRAKGDFSRDHSKHLAPVLNFPALHVSRYDFGDLDSKKAPYALLPDASTRKVEQVSVAEMDNMLELTVKDSYDHFAGVIQWLVDKNGTGKVSYDYTYSGDQLDSREIGIMFGLGPQYDEVKWRRWSEWGKFSKDSICRTEGSAKAHRDKKWPKIPANVRPSWPWSQDQTELGTTDFRSIKFCIYEAALEAGDGSGVLVIANADAHFRTCLADEGVKMHILSQCTLAPVVLKKGDRLKGSFCVSLIGKS